MLNAKPPEFDLEQTPLGAHARSKAPVIEHEDSDARRNHPAHAALSAQDRNFVAQHIAAEQIRLLYRFSLAGYLAELLVAFLLGAILWNDLNDFSKHAALLGWFAATLVVMLARYGLYKLFIRARPPMNVLPMWENALSSPA